MNKQITVTNIINNPKYFKLSFNRKNFHMISKSEFRNIPWPCISMHGHFFKYSGCTRQDALFLIKCFEFKPQGIISDIKGAYTALQDAVKVLSKAQKWVENVDLKYLFAQTLDLLLALLNLSRNNDALSVVTLGYKVYTFITCIDAEFKPQGLEELVLSSISLLLPPSISQILKRLQLLSNSKLLDDPSNFQFILDILADLIEKCYALVQKVIPPSLVVYLDYFKTMSTKYAKAREINNLVGSLDKNPKLCVDVTFVRKVEELYAHVQSNIGLLEYAKKSAYYKNLLDKLERAFKTVKSHKEYSRKEPNAFILEGKPGCGKSVLMNMVLQAIGEPTYTHIVKTTEDGKDFYDLYQGEKVFNMDDVGQMGVSQWRTLINTVSCAKLPLPCADVKLKNTKYFTSDIILCTTNDFMHLNNVVRADGIADLNALKRRGYVFDMNSVKFTGHEYTGCFYFRHFDLSTLTFINDFPKVLKTHFNNQGIDIPVKIQSKNKNEIISWMYTIIMAMDRIKSTFSVSNELTVSDINDIRNRFQYQSAMEDIDELLRRVGIEPIEQEYDRDIVDIDALQYNRVELDDQSQLEYPRAACLPVEEDWSFVDEHPVQTWSSLLYDLMWMGLDKLKDAANWAMNHSVLFIIIPYFIHKAFVDYKRVKINPVAKPQSQEVATLIKDKLSMQQNVQPHSLSSSVSKNVLPVRIRGRDGVVFKTLGVLSGHHVIVPAHNVLGGDVGYISVSACDGKGLIYDNMEYKVILEDAKEDVAVLRLPLNIPTYMKNISSAFKPTSNIESTKLSLCALGLVSTVNKPSRTHQKDFLIYRNIAYNAEFIHDVANVAFYDIQEEGLCGAVVSNEQGCVLGMHVAGNVQTNVGAAVIWSENLKSRVYKILLDDNQFYSKYAIKKTIGESGFKIDKKENVYTNNKSDLIPSPIYQVFPVTRRPANLRATGDHTIKDIAAKSFKQTKDVHMKSLEFAKRAIATLINPYSVIPEGEIVRGNEWLAPLNKDSSNGYGCTTDKLDYINFNDGTLTEKAKNEIKRLKADISAGVYNDEDWFWVEALKDEIRNDEKVEKPRSFRIARVTTQILMKEIFGDMVASIMSQREFNQIMVGVNPFEEWDSIYMKLEKCHGVWAGDIGSYDGNMLPQVQAAIHDILLEQFRGTEEDKKMCSFLLRDMMNTTVVVNDDVLRTTHSMPSGSYLTAIGNSLVNRFYTLMWYYENVQSPSLSDFNAEIIDYVYGDDKLNGLRSEKYAGVLNAQTMASFFSSLGMTFTTASKGEITKPFEDLSEVSFLKRFFTFHPELGRVMCPLDLRTLESGLSWINRKKDLDEVMFGKISTFQRELYLYDHTTRKEKVAQLKEACEIANVPYAELPDLYLKHVYTYERDAIKGLSWGGSKYM